MSGVKPLPEFASADEAREAYERWAAHTVNVPYATLITRLCVLWVESELFHRSSYNKLALFWLMTAFANLTLAIDQDVDDYLDARTAERHWWRPEGLAWPAKTQTPPL